MWAYELTAPRCLQRTEVPAAGRLAPGQVLVGLQAGGICGSDVPKFLGVRTFTSERDHPGPGYPMHEIAGTVLASADPRFTAGDRVAGFAAGQAGLREQVVTTADGLTVVPDQLTAVESVVVQPLSTVLYALDRLPDLAGRNALVIGLGPIGLLFCHALHQAGARVVGVDPVDRSEVAATFGIDELFVGNMEQWLAEPHPAADICIEAVGHQTETLVQAVHATAKEGHLYAFGVPDHEFYTLPLRAAFDRAITLYFGVTLRWSGVLERAARYLSEHPSILKPYISHVLPLDRVNEAYELCTGTAPDRLKIIVTTE